jgi:hypothetical protein
MQLKESLTLLQKGDRSISNYMQVVRTTVDELAMIDTPLSNDDITLYVLNGLGTDCKDIIAPIRTRETSLTFEELQDILTPHETYLKRIKATQSQLMAIANNTQRTVGHYYQRQPRNYQRGNLQRPRWYGDTNHHHNNQFQRKLKCQFCEEFGHTVKNCLKLQPVIANYVSKSAEIKGKWLDTGASHNITSDLSNLFIHYEYDGTNAVVIRDGSSLPITHIGSLTFNHKSYKFLLIDTLGVPSIQKNLIFMHYFTKVNNVLIEFHPDYFLMKDWFTGATLLQGQSEDGVYSLSTLSTLHKISTNPSQRASQNLWHSHLGQNLSIYLLPPL